MIGIISALGTVLLILPVLAASKIGINVEVNLDSNKSPAEMKPGVEGQDADAFNGYPKISSRSKGVKSKGDVPKCHIGFEALEGDSLERGKPIGHKPDSNSCGKACIEDPDCCSYEWSPTKKNCNLIPECQPNAPKWEDYIFCSQKDVTKCHDGFDAHEGDVSGAYKNIGKIPDSTTCGQACLKDPVCCSYEWSPTTKYCNFIKECQPTQGKFQDYIFCSRKDVTQCHDGFEALEGDVSGDGMQAIYQIPDSDTCGRACIKNPLCCAYEWSPSKKHCNLMKECQPTQGKHQDYIYCSRKED